MMCDMASLNRITEKVVNAAKENLGKKLDKVILYGSYARGDYNDESDIDILILADIPLKNRWREREKIREIIGRIDMDYDVVLCLSVVDSDTFNKYLPVEPFYTNVLKDGLILSA